MGPVCLTCLVRGLRREGYPPPTSPNSCPSVRSAKSVVARQLSFSDFPLMKLVDTATVGVRVVGVAAMAFGVVLALTTAVMHSLMQLPLGGISSSDLQLHDTYYVVTHVQYDLLVPSGAGLLVGTALLLTSRRLGQLLTRGLENP